MRKPRLGGIEYHLPSVPQPFQNLKLEAEITDEPSPLRLAEHNKMLTVHVLNLKEAGFLTGYLRSALSAKMDMGYLIWTSNNTVEQITGKEQAQDRLASESIQMRVTLTPASGLGAAMPQRRKNDVFV